jgi:hypothetical protein
MRRTTLIGVGPSGVVRPIKGRSHTGTGSDRLKPRLLLGAEQTGAIGFRSQTNEKRPAPAEAEAGGQALETKRSEKNKATLELQRHTSIAA